MFPLTKSASLTDVLAIWGAALSSALALRTFIYDRRRIRVSCRWAVAAPPQGGTWEFVTIQAVNIGHRPVEIASAGLLGSDGGQFIQPTSRFGPQPFGRKLADGEAVTFYFDLDEVKKAAIDLARSKKSFKRAFVRDAEGRRYRTRIGVSVLSR